MKSHPLLWILVLDWRKEARISGAEEWRELKTFVGRKETFRLVKRAKTLWRPENFNSETRFCERTLISLCGESSDFVPWESNNIEGATFCSWIENSEISVLRILVEKDSSFLFEDRFCCPRLGFLDSEKEPRFWWTRRVQILLEGEDSTSLRGEIASTCNLIASQIGN